MLFLLRVIYSSYVRNPHLSFKSIEPYVLSSALLNADAEIYMTKYAVFTACGYLRERVATKQPT